MPVEQGPPEEEGKPGKPEHRGIPAPLRGRDPAPRCQRSSKTDVYVQLDIIVSFWRSPTPRAFLLTTHPKQSKKTVLPRPPIGRDPAGRGSRHAAERPQGLRPPVRLAYSTAGQRAQRPAARPPPSHPRVVPTTHTDRRPNSARGPSRVALLRGRYPPAAPPAAGKPSTPPPFPADDAEGRDDVVPFPRGRREMPPHATPEAGAPIGRPRHCLGSYGTGRYRETHGDH